VCSARTDETKPAHGLRVGIHVNGKEPNTVNIFGLDFGFFELDPLTWTPAQMINLGIPAHIFLEIQLY
jgi:hypothetical protein